MVVSRAKIFKKMTNLDVLSNIGTFFPTEIENQVLRNQKCRADVLDQTCTMHKFHTLIYLIFFINLENAVLMKQLQMEGHICTLITFVPLIHFNFLC